MNSRVSRQLRRAAARADALARRAARFSSLIRSLPRNLPPGDASKMVQVRSEHAGHLEITLLRNQSRVYLDLEILLAEQTLRILASGARGREDASLLVPSTNRSLRRALQAARRFLQ